MVTVRNNFDFPARTPATIPAETLSQAPPEQPEAAGGQRVPAQQLDGRLVFIADIPAQCETVYLPDPDASTPDGIAVSWHDGVLRISRPASDLTVELTLGLIEGDMCLYEAPPVDAAEWPEMTIHAPQSGSVFTRLELTGQWQSYRIDLAVVCFHAGYVDIEVGVTNEAAERKHAYLALVKKLSVNQPVTGSASRLYGRVKDELQFEPPPDILFQGLDWATIEGSGWAVELMNDQTFNWHKLTPDGKWYLDCNGRMAMHRLAESNADLCCVTAITGRRYEKTKYDADGDYDHITPPTGKRVSYAMRLCIDDPLATARANENFILYEGYRRSHNDNGVPVIDLGVRHTTIGVLYIPDRLAEDFVLWHSDTTVGKTNDLLMKPESRQLIDFIERDFRIMSALGLVCRYHHLKARNDVELEMVRLILETARTYGVKMCLDIDYEPGAIAAIDELNREFSDIIEFNEPMNEAIYADAATGEYCQGVNVDYLERAREMLTEFHKSDVPVIITISKGMGAYLGIAKQAGLEFSAASSHDYFSGFRRGWRPVEEQIEETYECANYPISLGNYCAAHDLQPMATEAGWGGLTHLSDEDRVKVCEHLYREQMMPRGLTHIYKCWFMDTFWKRHGRRHYDLVRWDRTLRGEGRLLSDLQKQHGPPDLPINQVAITCNEGEIETVNPFELSFTVRNISGGEITVSSVTVDGPVEIHVAIAEAASFDLADGEARDFTAVLAMEPESKSGYYHVFPVVRYADGQGDKTICGWSLLRHRSFTPERLDVERVPYGELVYEGGVEVLRQIDLNQPTTIVVGEKATRKDAEWAYNLHNVLHSILANDDLDIRWETYRPTQPHVFEYNLIVIGAPANCRLMREYAASATGPRIVLAEHREQPGKKVLLLLGDSQDAHGWQDMELARHDEIEDIDVVCADVIRRFVSLSRYYISPRIGIIEAFGGAGAVDTDKTLT